MFSRHFNDTGYVWEINHPFTLSTYLDILKIIDYYSGLSQSIHFHIHIHSFNQYSFINNSKTFIYTSDHCQLLDLYLHLHTGYFYFYATYTSQIKHVTYENAHSPQVKFFFYKFYLNEWMYYILPSLQSLKSESNSFRLFYFIQLAKSCQFYLLDMLIISLFLICTSPYNFLLGLLQCVFLIRFPVLRLSHLFCTPLYKLFFQSINLIPSLTSFQWPSTDAKKNKTLAIRLFFLYLAIYKSAHNGKSHL